MVVERRETSFHGAKTEAKTMNPGEGEILHELVERGYSASLTLEVITPDDIHVEAGGMFARAGRDYHGDEINEYNISMPRSVMDFIKGRQVSYAWVSKEDEAKRKKISYDLRKPLRKLALTGAIVGGTLGVGHVETTLLNSDLPERDIVETLTQDAIYGTITELMIIAPFAYLAMTLPGFVPSRLRTGGNRPKNKNK